MRLFSHLFVALCLSVFVIPAAVQAQQDEFLVTPEGVGDVKIGMTVAAARRTLPGYSFSRTSDGEGVALIEVKRGNRTHFYLYANEFDPASPIDDNARIVFMEVTNPAYRTAAGVHPNMLLRDVESRYGKLESIVLSEIEAREFARFAGQPLGIDLRVMASAGQAGVYASGESTATRYDRNAYVYSIIVLGRDEPVSGGGGEEEEETPAEGFASRYTDLGSQCRTPPGQGAEGGHISTYCTGYGGYRVHIFDTATTMEINIQSEDGSRSVPVASQSLGFDMQDRKIEWRFRDGKPFAVIMRADTYRTGSDGLISYPARKTGEFLIVKGLPGFEQIDHRVDARTTRNANEEARKLADQGFALKKDETLDIATYNRTIINAARQNQPWVRSPMETAVRLAGEFTEMRSRTLEMQTPSAEGGDKLTLTVTNEGLLDDSVRAERFIFELEKNRSGIWLVTSARKSWACWPGRGHEDFSAAPCL